MRKRYIFYAVTDTNSLIIFDEVQMFPQARAAIKYLVGEVDSVMSCGCEKIERFS
jgi:predicted AAA+ superfamily ATPase